MGLDVAAISRAVRLRSSGDEYDDDDVFFVSSHRRRRDSLKPGCYIVGRGGKRFCFRAGTYAGFDSWRRNLCQLVLGVEPEEIWAYPRRFRGKPFVELIDFPDSVGGVIGPNSSAKLCADFNAYAPRARRYYAGLSSDRTESAAASPGVKRRFTKRALGNSLGARSAVNVAAAVGGQAMEHHVDIRGMWDVYRNFRKAFGLARDSGLVLFE